VVGAKNINPSNSATSRLAQITLRNEFIEKKAFESTFLNYRTRKKIFRDQIVI
jgi:hypothetical protein